MKIPVEGNPNLYRDISSGAILNCSDIEFKNYEQAKRKKLQEIGEFNEIKNKMTEIEEIKNELSELKNLMRDIVDKLTS